MPTGYVHYKFIVNCDLGSVWISLMKFFFFFFFQTHELLQKL